jgi:hypothetical protein
MWMSRSNRERRSPSLRRSEEHAVIQGEEGDVMSEALKLLNPTRARVASGCLLARSTRNSRGACFRAAVIKGLMGAVFALTIIGPVAGVAIADPGKTTALQTALDICANRTLPPPGVPVTLDEFKFQAGLLGYEVTHHNHLFRVDQRPPSAIRDCGGFLPNPNKPSQSMWEHCKLGSPGGGNFVSTSAAEGNSGILFTRDFPGTDYMNSTTAEMCNPDIATLRPFRQYIYEYEMEGSGVRLCNAAYDKEVEVVTAGISSNQIRRWRVHLGIREHYAVPSCGKKKTILHSKQRIITGPWNNFNPPQEPPPSEAAKSGAGLSRRGIKSKGIGIGGKAAKGCGTALAVFCIYQNTCRFARACDDGDLGGMGEAAWDQFGPPISPWEAGRSYDEAISQGAPQGEAVAAAPCIMYGRTMHGFAGMIATGAECAFGWTAPRGSKAMPGVWSPWRECEQ